MNFLYDHSPINRYRKQDVTDKLTRVDPQVLIDYSRKLMREKQANYNNYPSKIRVHKQPKPTAVKDAFQSQGLW